MISRQLFSQKWPIVSIVCFSVFTLLLIYLCFALILNQKIFLATVLLPITLISLCLLSYQITLRCVLKKTLEDELLLIQKLHLAIIQLQNKQSIKVTMDTQGNERFNTIIDCFNNTIEKQLFSENRFQELAVQLQEKNDQLKAQQKSDYDRNQNLHKMFAGASHDFRQPLQAMVIFISAIQEHSTAKQAPLLQKLEQVVENLNDLCTDLLDISKLESRMKRIPKKNVAIAPLLEKIYDEFEALAHDKRIEFRLYNRDLSVFSNPNMLERIIRNMISNAIRYTRTGGVLIGCRKREEEIWIEVWDTGRGIPQDKMDDIFNEFVQLDDKSNSPDKGVGLGLFIVKRLAQLLDHSIIVSSALHKGTMFRIVVPVQPMYPHHELPSQHTSNIPVTLESKDLNIALIDDDHVIRSCVSTLLQSWGMYVQVFDSIHSLEHLEKPDKTRLDLIISDFQLGIADTGIDAIQVIRKQQGNNTPSIIITGTTNAELLETIQKHAIPILKKPVKPAKLRALINMLCDE